MQKQRSKVIYDSSIWTREYVSKYPNYLFVYGDNVQRKGTYGQANIRFETNTYGIPTKWKPTDTRDAYFYDIDDDVNGKVAEIWKDIFNELYERSKYYDYIVFSKNGIGTGLAKMPLTAPRTFVYLIELIDNLKARVNNG